MNRVSDCHAASLEVAGRSIVRYWICRECGEACEADLAEDTRDATR